MGEVESLLGLIDCFETFLERRAVFVCGCWCSWRGGDNEVLEGLGEAVMVGASSNKVPFNFSEVN